MALLALSGCGGGDNNSGQNETAADGIDTAAATGSLSKTKLIERGDKICYQSLAGGEAAILEYEEQYNLNPQTVTVGGHAVRIARTILIPAYQGQIDDIRSLGAPKEDEKAVAAILRSMQQVVNDGREHPAAFVRSLVHGKPFAGATRLAKAYGFTLCARS